MNLFKPYLLLFAGLLSASFAMAQTSAYADYVRPENETSVSAPNNISFGLGLGGYYPYSGAFYGQTPSLILMYDKTALKHVGPGTINIGAVLSYKRISSDYQYQYGGYTYLQEWNYYTLGLRCSYHFQIASMHGFEPYTGIMGGYNIVGFDFKSNDPNSSEPYSPGYYLEQNSYPDYFSFSIFAGASDKISNKVSVWLEIGYGYISSAFGVRYSF
jgi:hypothetical protein